MNGRLQRGASLFITLIMLLLISLLAIASIREVTLEARITAHQIEQQRLYNAAEAALREGERRLLQQATLGQLPDLCTGTLTNATPCITSKVVDDYSYNNGVSTGGYTADFTTAFAYQGLDGSTSLDRTARWYIREIPPSDQSTCTENYLSNTPDDTGRCQNFYEINAQAFRDGTNNSTTCGPDILCLRSTISVASP